MVSSPRSHNILCDYKNNDLCDLESIGVQWHPNKNVFVFKSKRELESTSLLDFSLFYLEFLADPKKAAETLLQKPFYSPEQKESEKVFLEGVVSNAAVMLFF